MQLVAHIPKGLGFSQDGSLKGPTPSVAVAPVDSGLSSSRTAGDRSGHGGSAPPEPASVPESEQQGAEKAEEVQDEAPKVSREDKASAARERFLARKRKVPG